MGASRQVGFVAALGAVSLGAVSLVAVACKDNGTIHVNGGSAGNVAFAKRDSVRQLGPGDLRIATTDSAIEVALIGDSLVAGFGAKTRDQIKQATDTNSVSGSGFGASIEKMVKSSVAGALDREMRVPLSDVSDVQYDDGMLVFYDKQGKRMNFFNRDHGKPRDSQARFTEGDAKGFIALFKAKTGKA